MSQLLRSAPKTQVTSTLQRTAIMTEPNKSTFQIDSPVTASPSSISPGGSTVLNVRINDRTWSQEQEHFLVWEISNNSSAQTATFKRGPITLWDSIILTIQNSRDKIEILSPDQLIEIYSEFAFTRGLNVYQDLFFIRGEFDTFNGITVTNGTPVTFYLSLAPIFDFGNTCLRNSKDQLTLMDLKFDLKARSAPSNANDACQICQSSTTSPAYTQANITFSNIRFIRHYTILNDLNLYIGALASTIPIQQVNFKVESKVVRSGTTWNLGDSVNFKLSDILKRSGIQYIVPVVRIDSSAYNDTNAQREFSGFNYLGYKYR